ncbi:type II/IV secretion system ATPase subunit [Candidatus Woesearchaeota archaeon]|nr:type II/IV secretion system ATPase subunit [Candidatus Woesearchaeota archaeon]
MANYEVIREGEDITLRINCEALEYFPSIEEEPRAMALVIDIIAEAGTITKIILEQKRDYEYDNEQTELLVEIANLYKIITKQKTGIIKPECQTYTGPRYIELQNIIFNELKTSPIDAYLSLRKIAYTEQSILKKTTLTRQAKTCIQEFLQETQQIMHSLEQTKLFKKAKEDITEHKKGSREIYRKIFMPIIKPDFMYTKLLSAYPSDAEQLDSYMIGETEVTIFQMPNSVQTLYHIVPPEFKLTEEKYEILDAARKILAEHKPKRTEFTDPERMRQVFQNIGSDLLDELAGYRNIKLREKEKKELSQILVRYTVGFGLIEVLLEDEQIQDITINSPMGRIPLFIVHGEYGDCITNIIPTPTEAESWASKLRMISGRPLDEANPILDTELRLPQARARVAAITAPLNPTGLAYALRRHRGKPWTLPLFIKYKMITPLAAGLISFLIDGARTILIAGTRSSGKTSFLGSIMVEIMRKGRIITVEDTLELPTDALRKLEYNIQSMKVASALTRGSTEVTADEGIRTTLRLGDSSLIVGEVRSTEAKALYEAMRVGALANVVAGTIHGDSPYGVFDRVVNDLGVPKTSFKATDIIIIANPIRSPDGLHKWRRITQITEVRKHWENDPLREAGFVDLMKYDAKTDQLVPTPDLLNGDSEVLKSIAGNVKEWAGNWDAVWENIELRAKIKENLFEYSEKLKKPELLEADFTVLVNDEFHQISDEVTEETGKLDSKKILFKMNEWLKRNTKKYEEE